MVGVVEVVVEVTEAGIEVAVEAAAAAVVEVAGAEVGMHPQSEGGKGPLVGENLA